MDKDHKCTIKDQEMMQHSTLQLVEVIAMLQIITIVLMYKSINHLVQVLIQVLQAIWH